MKALTLRQPWASLVAYGYKRFETRSWRTSHAGPLAITASGTMTLEEHRLVIENKAMFRRLRREQQPPNGVLPTGVIVAVVWLEGCKQAPGVELGLKTLDRAAPERRPAHWHAGDELEFGDFSEGRWAWALHSAALLDYGKVAVRGYPGLWNLPEEAEVRVMSDLAAGEPGVAGLKDPLRQWVEEWRLGNTGTRPATVQREVYRPG